MAQIKNVAQGAYVTVIDPSDAPKPKLRVAACARVSSDSADQLNSYLAQVDYYTRFISSREDWELADVYADEGKSGTSTKKRKEFNQLIADCEKGKIDLVITKSVSRFGRNTLDDIQYVRKLKRLGTGRTERRRSTRSRPKSCAASSPDTSWATASALSERTWRRTASKPSEGMISGRPA